MAKPDNEPQATKTVPELAHDLGLISQWSMRWSVWMGKHVWGPYSPFATRFTDLCDKSGDRWPRYEWLFELAVSVMGTGNYFS